MKLKQRFFMWSRGRTPVTATIEVTVDDFRWLHAALTNVFRRVGVRSPEVSEATFSADDLLSLLAPLQLQGTQIAEARWLDEAHTPADTRLLVLASRPAVVLGRKEEKVLVLKAGTGTSEIMDFAEFRAAFPGCLLYQLTGKDDEETSETFGWKWFLKAFFARKKVIRDVVMASLVVQLIGLAFPLATQAIVDKVISNQAMSTLIALGVGIGMFSLANATLSWLRQKLLLRLANVVDAELSVKVILHLFRLPLRYFEARPTGILTTRVKGIARVREFAAGAFLLLAIELPFMLVFLFMMVSYSWQLSGVVLLFVAAMLGLSFACGPYLRSLSNKQYEAGAKVQSFLTERISAHETVKSLQLENESVSRFAELNRKELDTSLALREFGNGYGTFMQLAEQLMGVAVLCLGAYLAMTSTSLSIGMLVAFQMFSQRVAQPLLKLSNTWQELQQIRTAVSQLGEVMRAPTERYGAAATSVGRVRGLLEVQSLGFRHAPDCPPLYSDLNFKVEPGQVALLTGPSGSGKSTLAKIMLGLYGSYEGFVRIDGRDIRSMTVNELRGVFGVVPQETVLFAGTILDNVMAGGQASFDQVVQACRMAGVHDVIENMAEGYQTTVGERGVGLSGGQRQRIGIARALLKRPAVLVFDEATSGLDYTSAEHIGTTVNYLKGKVTVLFIAHKVPQCLQADAHVKL